MSAAEKITDESQDQKYFTITPRLVWAFSRTPFDYTLWSVIKGVAGDSGECYLTTEDLAILSMMSMGQVSDSRKYWMSIGLIFGDFKRDPGYPQPVWHMRIPNIWKANIEWAEKYAGIKERVQYKRAQAENLRLERAEKRRKQEESASLHQKEPSPGEGGVTPGETKNNHKKNQKNSVSAKADERAGQVSPNTGNRTDAVVKGDGMDGILFYARQAAAINAELENRINAFPPDCQTTLRTLTEFFSWQSQSIPEKPARESKGGQYALWINEIREINTQAGQFGQDGIRAAAKASKDLTVSHPGAITWAIAGEIGKLVKRDSVSSAQPVSTPYTRALENSQPISEAGKRKLEEFRRQLAEKNAKRALPA